jgi:hypothetical protein
MNDGRCRGSVLLAWVVGVNFAALTTACSGNGSGESPDSGLSSSGDAGATDSSANDVGISDAAPDACDAAGGGTIPDLTAGYWVYQNSIDSAGVEWDGSNLTFRSVTPACGGATLTAVMNWFSSNGQYSTTESYTGAYVAATRHVSWNGQSLSDSRGGVVLENDVATYDPSTDQLVNGSWVGGNPGTFVARHVIDAGSAPGPTDAGSD